MSRDYVLPFFSFASEATATWRFTHFVLGLSYKFLLYIIEITGQSLVHNEDHFVRDFILNCFPGGRGRALVLHPNGLGHTDLRTTQIDTLPG